MKRHLNLLPPTHSNFSYVKKSLGLWALVLALGVIWIVYSTNIKLERADRIHQQRTALEREFDHVKAMSRDAKLRRTELQRLDNLVDIAERIEDRQPVLTLLGTIAQAVGSAEAKASIHQMKLDQVQGTNNQYSSYQLSLNGVAVDNMAVAKLIASLEKSKRFAVVQLRDSKDTKIAGKHAKTFKLECSF